MPEKTETTHSTKPHSLTFADGVLTVNGVAKVVEVSEKEAQLKLSDSTLQIRGSGLNVVKLDREQGVVQLENKSLQSLIYRQGGAGGLKGLFR